MAGIARLENEPNSRNLVTGLWSDNQSSRREAVERERERGGKGREKEGERAGERNLTYQLAPRSDGLTPRGPLTARRSVFEV